MIEITPFMDELLSYTVVFPAMVLCYLPMRDQLRLPLPGLGLLFAGIYCILLSAAFVIFKKNED